jgi:hypothetical protein
VTQLATTGCRQRCCHPLAKLAELRVLQGRLEETEALLIGFESVWECAVVAAALLAESGLGSFGGLASYVTRQDHANCPAGL